MSDVPSHLDLLRDPRLATHATSATPVWLWGADATRILWANSVGAAIFGSETPAALIGRRFDPHDPAAAQIGRLAGSLPQGGPGRLERLRGFGTGFWRMLLCSCARISLPDHTTGILVVALEPAGPALSLAERVRRLYDGADKPIAAFTPDGTLLYAMPQARDLLGGATNLAALGAQPAAQDAIATGRATGMTPIGPVTIERIGADAATVLVATFAAAAITTARPAAAAPTPRPAPPAPPVEAPVAPPPSAPQPAAPAPAAPTASTSPSPPPPQAPAAEDTPIPPLRLDVPLPDRRHPLRFVWQMNAEGRFTLGSDEFTELIGPRIATALGRHWKDVAAELALDPEDQVARAVATRDTWSGITVSWPVEGSVERLKVELSGLPVYDRNRNFLGYRGFGVCRDIDRIATLAAMRRAALLAPAQPHRANAANPPTAAHDATKPATATPDASTSAPTTPAAATANPHQPSTPTPAAPNVVPFRSSAAPAPSAPPVGTKAPALSPVERNAFRELARQLTARLKGASVQDESAAPVLSEANPPPPEVAAVAAPAPSPSHVMPDIAPEPRDEEAVAERPLLDRIPVGILVYRLDHLLYANRAFLDWTGYRSLEELAEAGGLDNLFIEGGDLGEAGGPGRTLAITTHRGDKMPVEGRLFSIPWNGESALVLMLVTAGIDDRHKATELSLRLAEAQTRELKAILDTATDGVLVLERDGRVVSANRSAQALFGYEADALNNMSFADLFAPESQGVALGYLENLARGGVRGLINDGRELIGRVRQGGDIPLFMTMGRIADESERVCVVLRDVTPWKKAEGELLAAKQSAEKTSAAKSDFLAKISHEIRTPLNSIIGFSEVMIDERFGPIGNERYREYLKDIRNSGTHVVSLLNDLLDLSKIEAGKLDLTFASLNLNEVVQSCVALMQPQANRERIIIRTSLAPGVRPVVADARSVRQIVLNLLSNSLKFTAAGGQVIVSTALNDDGAVVLRVRDTGVGMTETDIVTALEPFRQLATSPRGGTGLGLPLTKAMAEANRAKFRLTSTPKEGTLVEITFPASSIPAG